MLLCFTYVDSNCVRPFPGAGTHCEGGVWATLFGLLLWPALFAAVPDALRRYAPYHCYGVPFHVLLSSWCGQSLQ